MVVRRVDMAHEDKTLDRVDTEVILDGFGTNCIAK